MAGRKGGAPALAPHIDPEGFGPCVNCGQSKQLTHNACADCFDEVHQAVSSYVNTHYDALLWSRDGADLRRWKAGSDSNAFTEVIGAVLFFLGYFLTLAQAFVEPGTTFFPAFGGALLGLGAFALAAAAAHSKSGRLAEVRVAWMRDREKVLAALREYPSAKSHGDMRTLIRAATVNFRILPARARRWVAIGFVALSALTAMRWLV